MDKLNFVTDIKYTYGRYQIVININYRGSLRMEKIKNSRTIFLGQKDEVASQFELRSVAKLIVMDKIEIT